MKVLITGGSGLLGQYLNIELSKGNDILTLFNKKVGNCINYNSIKIDINNYNSLENIFESFKPNVVIHTAAISSPNKSNDLDTKYVFSTNVNSTKKIAELCNKLNSKLIYTSTDLVYAGYRGSLLNENSKLIPVSLYAETKLMGEVKIQETFDNYIILRTALLYGFGLNQSINQFSEMFNKLKNKQEVKLFADQYRTPLSLIDAAKMINQLLDKDIKNEIINFGGIQRISRYELGKTLCDCAGFDKSLLKKIKMTEIPDYPLVEDVSMNNEKLQSIGIKAKPIEESIKEILNSAGLN